MNSFVMRFMVFPIRIDFIKALDELDDIQKAKLAQEFITSYSMAISFEQFVSYMKNGGIK